MMLKVYIFIFILYNLDSNTYLSMISYSFYDNWNRNDRYNHRTDLSKDKWH